LWGPALAGPGRRSAAPKPSFHPNAAAALGTLGFHSGLRGEVDTFVHFPI
jgi:hypothetical protein